MSECRRGFLTKMIACGSALIMPNGHKEIVASELLLRPVNQVRPAQTFELGDYYLIPKKSVTSFNLEVSRSFDLHRMPYVRFAQDNPSAYFSINGVLPEGVCWKQSGKKTEIVAPDGALLFEVNR